MGSPTCEIDGRTIGPGEPTFLIAEIGQAHDGSLGTAHAYIDAVAHAGADAIKFQTHIAHAESTPEERFRVNVFPQDSTRYEYWKRMEFTQDQWTDLAAHAREKGLIFLSTPFSLEAVELLSGINMAAWKVGSGEVTNLRMLEIMASTGKPVLLSSGMSTWSELDGAVSTIEKAHGTYGIFQCTTSYPCPADQLGLNVIAELRERYGCPVGLSDHSGGIFGSLAAVALGADLIEVHTVFSRECFGPDVSSSVTNAELAQLVAGIKFIRQALDCPIDKDREAAARSELRLLFGKSLVASRPLPAGHQLCEQDIAMKKPGTGIPAGRISEFVGRTLKVDYQVDQPFAEQDID